VAHVSALRRTRVGPFGEDQAVTMEEATGAPTSEKLAPEARSFERFDACLVPISDAMAEYPNERVNGHEAQRLRSGQGIVLTPARAKVLRAGTAGALDVVLAEDDDGEVALCRLDGLTLAPSKVFQLGA
jgi:tRNA pseudouridine55 synthase